MSNTLSFDEAKARWELIFKDPLLSLTSLREKGVKGNICTQGLRSICWKLYLSYLPSLDTSTWPLTLHKERQHYEDLRQRYITSPTADSENDDMNDLNVNNPLSLDHANPWQEYFKDNELRKIISQDVERTFPENEYFRSPENQSRLLDILFIYCKMNQDVSYRQGMHELLAPILWVVDHDSLLSNRGYAVDTGEDAVIRQTLNTDFVEHDAFALFSSLMKAAKVYYEYNDEVFNRRPVMRNQGSESDNARLIANAQAEAAKVTPVIMKCNKIYDEYLRITDVQLYNHLKKLDIEPQLYGIRWIRLLFGREFPLDQVLYLWDGMFAEDPTLRIVDFVCVAMMILIRDELLESDYAGCLSMLMRYPPAPEVDFLVKQAIYLRDHLSIEGGAQIIHENAVRMNKNIPLAISHVNRIRQSSASNSPIPDNIKSRSVPGEVKKNVPRRSELSISRPDYDARKRSAEFSQRHGTNSYYLQKEAAPDPPRSENHQSSLSAEMVKLKEQNRQMAVVVSKSIELLEQELFVRSKNKDISHSADREKIDKSPSGSNSSFEDISNNNEGNSTLSANEISILHALTGLKHVRDVLNGSTKEFNPGVFYGPGQNSEEHDHWEVVDDEISVVSVLSTTGEDDETGSITKETVQTKQEKNTPVPNATGASSQIIDVASKPLPRTPPSSPPQPAKPLPPPKETSNVGSSIISSTTSAPPAKTRPITQSKPRINFNDVIEEIAKSDLQSKISTPKTTITSDYAWMVEGAEDDENSLFNPKRATTANLNGLDRSMMSTNVDDDLLLQISANPSSTRRVKNQNTKTITSSTFVIDKDDAQKHPLGVTPKNVVRRERSPSVGSASSPGDGRLKTTNNTTSAIRTEDPLGAL